MGRRFSTTGRRRFGVFVVILLVGLGQGRSDAARRRKKPKTPAAELEESAAEGRAKAPADTEPAPEAPSADAPTNGTTAPGQAETSPQTVPPIADSPPRSPDDDGEEAAASPSSASTFSVLPAIPAPALRGVAPISRLYLDASWVRSRDLSALPYIAGSGYNYRAAFGGAWARGGFQLEGEITFAQATTIHVTEVPGGMPIPEDQTQTATSLGDSYLGVSWVSPLGDWPVQVGASLRGRIPTHTTIFQFHLLDNSIGRYPFPYYFHIEPAFLGGAVWGPLSLVLNEGPLVLMGPDGNFAQLHIVVPTLWFWDSHVALALALGRTFGLSAELVTTFLTSHIDQPEFAKLNGLMAVSLNPGLQMRFERFQVDLIGRIGLNKGAEAFGVVVFSGTQGLLLRVSLFFP